MNQPLPAPISRIRTARDLEQGLALLLRRDRRLAPIARRAGPLPMRRRRPGFEALAAIVVSQQISRAAADTIFARLKTAVVPFTPERLAAAEEAALAAAGLSAPKRRHLRTIAGRIGAGTLDLGRLARLDDDAARAAMMETPGIGRWTADVYLMFSLGRADIWPAGDLALQTAVGEALALRARPDARRLDAIAEPWRPWRAVAARLFWAHYRVLRSGGEK